MNLLIVLKIDYATAKCSTNETVAIQMHLA